MVDRQAAQWWRARSIPALRRLEFEVSLVYRGSSRIAKATEKPCLRKKKSTDDIKKLGKLGGDGTLGRQRQGYL